MWWLIYSLAATAEPGRTTATGLAAWHSEPGVRGTLDYGLSRRLSVTAEVGLAPASVGLGPMFELIDHGWWRLSAVAMPELGWDQRVSGRAGLRVGWLAFWGLSVVGRADARCDRQGCAPDAGLGLAVRL